MGVLLSRIRLRSFMLMVLLPLTVLPLFILAGLLHLFIQRSFDEEVGRRAKPELAALARNLDTLENALLKQLNLVTRSDELKLEVLTLNENSLRSRFKPWLENSLFDEIRIYSFKGHKILSHVRGKTTKISPAWEQIFKVPEKRVSDRNPASEESLRLQSTTVENFEEDETRYQGQSLDSDFRSFILKETSWALRKIESTENKGQLSFYIYKSLLDSDGKAAGYLEGRVLMSSQKWAHLSLYQGVDYALINSQRQVISSSNEGFNEPLSSLLTHWKTIETSSDEIYPSRSVNMGEYPIEFFFAPLTRDSWIGVGISRSQHVFLQNRILVWVVGLTLLLAIAVSSFAYLTSEKLTEPINKLVSAAESVRAGNSVEPLRVEATEEIAYLVERFNEMALSVQAAKRTLESKLEELALTNDQLTQMQDQLVQSAKMSSLGQLVAGVAHELNNPIAFIYSNMVQMRQYLKTLKEVMSHIDQLKQSLSPVDRAQLEQLLVNVEWGYVQHDMEDVVQSCLEGSIRVKDIVLGLRNFSRLDKGQIAEVEINLALKNTAKLLASQLKNRVQLDWNLDAETQIRCNLSQVNQVMMNIMANAIQAIEGEGKIYIETKSVEHRGMECVRIRIKDSGQGMSSETISKIFDPFYTTKAVGEGTGLGLSIVYGIVQKHGGSIEVKSILSPHEDHGTAFDIYLPKKGPQVDTGLEEAS